jgi:hypothetical protein
VYTTGDYSHALMPVIQGNTLTDYEECIDQMQTDGLDQYDCLALGTVCKRTDRDAILEIIQLVREYYPDKHLHLFGATLRIWQDPRFHGLFDSSDTAAWNWGECSKNSLSRSVSSNSGRFSFITSSTRRNFPTISLS